MPGGAVTPKTVVVTGAGSGIGRATALAFASRGATVFAADLDETTAGSTARLCEATGGCGIAIQCDVSNATSMEAMAKTVLADHGAPDILVNNAGIGMAGAFLDTSIDDWAAILGVNVWGVILGCRLFAQGMVATGRGGHIVNVASAAAFTPSRYLPAYATTKAAVLMLSECLRAELAEHAIGVSAVCPGFANTGIAMATRYVGTSPDVEAQLRRRADRAYRRRNLTPETVAAAVVRAVDRNEALVTVGAEAKISRAVFRAAPGLSRRFAAMNGPFRTKE